MGDNSMNDEEKSVETKELKIANISRPFKDVKVEEYFKDSEESFEDWQDMLKRLMATYDSPFPFVRNEELVPILRLLYLAFKKIEELEKNVKQLPTFAFDTPHLDRIIDRIIVGTPVYATENTANKEKIEFEKRRKIE